jgi:signal transduction histidine kinase
MIVNRRPHLARRAPLASMETLAASIAHEVNQPLAAIVVNAECCLLWLRKEQPDLDMARKAAERIVRNGQHASEVIRSVRAMLGNMKGEMATVSINEVIAETLEILALEIIGGRIALETQLCPGPATVRCDRTQIRQVLLNLVRNAIEAMSSTVNTPRTLRIRALPDTRDEMTVSVSDSGPGLNASTAQRIFKPFFTTKSGGMGLGLAICRSIIQSHGGRLSARACAPHGCTFEFTLPTHGRC